jgi:hypothetical protein
VRTVPESPPFDQFWLLDGTDFKGSRLTVQFARGPRHKETFSGPSDRSSAPRPRRTIYRMQISGLPETSWQVSSTPFTLGSLGCASFLDRIIHLTCSAVPASFKTQNFCLPDHQVLRLNPFLSQYLRGSETQACSCKVLLCLGSIVWTLFSLVHTTAEWEDVFLHLRARHCPVHC